MAIAAAADQYFTYENRLASFQTAQQLSKRRTSNANSKAPKSIKWPHKFLSADELSKAGFFYYPLQVNPDNVACFLCHKSLDGWEEDDDPLLEHLKHSPNCGWAIVAMIERLDGMSDEEHPTSTRMAEARKATFADKWPHENKKGWKCKVKQMVEAGWKYTPTPEYDDTATCAYCSLALDGWEPSDKPLDEHFKRSPECPFFVLPNNNNLSPAAKKTKSRKGRNSRISTQSVVTTILDAPSFVEAQAEGEDSVISTATDTAKGENKMPKAKRATNVKGRKTRAKKSEAVEVTPVPEPEDNNSVAQIDAAPKAKRGRKRKSSEVLDPTASMIEVEAPQAKRRATRTRGSTVTDATAHGTEPDAPSGDSRPTGGRAKRGPSRARSTRNASAASAPVAPEEPIPNDEDLDAALQADLEKTGTDDEEVHAAVPQRKATRSSKVTKHSQFMLDTEPMNIDEAAIEAELEAMEIEERPLPKAKGAKGKQSRKPSAKQQAAAKRAAETDAKAQDAREEVSSKQDMSELGHDISMQHSPPVLQLKRQRAVPRQASRQISTRGARTSTQSVMPSDISIADNTQRISDKNGQNEESDNEADTSVASQSTVVRATTPASRRDTIRKAGKRGAIKDAEDDAGNGKGAHSDDIDDMVTLSVDREEREDSVMTEERYYTPAPEPYQVETRISEINQPKPARARGRPPKPAPEPLPTTAPERMPTGVDGTAHKAPIPYPVLPQQPESDGATPALRSSTPPPRERQPSISPQSSDVENQPPSSKPSTAKRASTPRQDTTRVPLVVSTPNMSPSKRNPITCLQSVHPWSAVDLDAVFLASPGNENVVGKDTLGNKRSNLKNGELTSPERKMTVEEWIHHNAAVAEERLRSECERMVGTFEREGTRAMRALEGIECNE